MEIPAVDLSGLLGQRELIVTWAPVVVIWLLAGISSAVVATNKGRNGCSWLMLGLLFGPIGLIFSSVVSKDYAALERRAIQRGEMQYCPFCAELIRAEAIKCRYCGENFGSGQQSDSVYLRRPGP